MPTGYHHALLSPRKMPGHLLNTQNSRVPREDSEMELHFSLGALTATGPGCHSPQNKGKCRRRSASVVFLLDGLEVRVKYLYKGFDLTLQLGLQWGGVGGEEAQDVRRVTLSAVLGRRVTVERKGGLCWNWGDAQGEQSTQPACLSLCPYLLTLNLHGSFVSLWKIKNCWQPLIYISILILPHKTHMLFRL